MKTRTKHMSWVILLVFLLMITSAGIPQNESSVPPPPEKELPAPPRPPGYPEKEKIIRQERGRPELPDLTIGQKEQIKKADLGKMKAITPLKNKIHEKRAHLVTILSSDDLNMNDVNKTVQELGDLHARILLAEITHDRELRALLSPEQKIVFDAQPKAFLKRK